MFEKKINDLVEKIGNTLPSQLSTLKEDLKKNISSMLQATLAEMNLVTREEFDVQKGVLEETRKKLDAIEKQLKQLDDQS